MGPLGGSMDSSDIEDHYQTPSDIGYGRLVKFDDDFLGRHALQKIANTPRRTKVMLVWNVNEVTSAIRSQLEPGTPAKFFDFPKSRYSYFQVDKIHHKGDYAGMSTNTGCITNEHAFIPIASIDVALSEPETQVCLLWGEAPNSLKPAVEPHRQAEIRATVAAVPYAQIIRDSYRQA
jgi:glycine cleavage system aminomethyltransferase T